MSLSKSDKDNIERVKAILKSSLAQQLTGQKRKSVSFDMLEVDSSIRDNLFYADVGHVGDIYEFPKELDRALGYPVRSQQMPHEFYRNNQMYGGECSKYLFKLDNRPEERMIVAIHYKTPEDEVFDAFIRGHEESHAVMTCSDPFDDFYQSVQKRTGLDPKKMPKEIDWEVLSHVGAIMAVSMIGVTLDEFIRKYKDRIKTPLKKYLEQAVELLF